MASTLRGRPAHAPGPAFFSYTPNGKKLITVGLNAAIRVFEHGSDDEPRVIDVSTENHSACVATNEFFVVGSEEGEVAKYSLITNRLDDVLARCTSAVRDLALSPDGQWLAIASDDIEVRVVNTNDMTKVIYLRDHSRSMKHVSFDSSGTLLGASCTDGLIYIYSLSSETPQLLKRIDGVIPMLRPDTESTAEVAWHPDGRAFAVATSSRGLQIIARSNWSQQKSFANGHKADITASAWSPNGALLVTAGRDKVLHLWDSQSQRILTTFSDIRDIITDIQWHPRENVLSYTNNNGELFIRAEFVPAEHLKLLKSSLRPAPLETEPLSDISGNARKLVTNGSKRMTEDDYLDDLLGPDAMSEGGTDFIDDDDGAGYAEEKNSYGKRAGDYLDERQRKRPSTHVAWQPRVHQPVQPGSTPWRGNRRYLCLNLTGFIWTVNQDLHNTVTVEFYDQQRHRDFHFTDPYLYDKACLNEKGTLFSCPSSSHHSATIYYRPHETWTVRTDWRTQLPAGEEVTAMSLSDSYIVVTTSAGYVRIYSLFGLPLKIHRQKSTPSVSCASWRDYVMTVGNGHVGADGQTRLLYSIEDVKRNEVCQNEDVLPLPPGTSLRSIFFSDKGDPCIYDTEGVLLVLLHWRTPGQAHWVPILDTKVLDRLADGRKEELYWPVAVANDRFHCIILKGGEQYPYFPAPLLSDFELRLPIAAPVDVPEGSTDESSAQQELMRQRELEEQYVRTELAHSLAVDVVENTSATSAQKQAVLILEREVDKVLLQLLANECREGEERGMKALEIATLMKDRTGKMLEAAGKVASRFHLDILNGKIEELAERRMVGLVNDDER